MEWQQPPVLVTVFGIALLGVLGCSGLDSVKQAATPPTSPVKRTFVLADADGRPGVDQPTLRDITALPGGAFLGVALREGQLVVFDSSGTIVARAGQSGSGPGDLGGPCCASTTDDGKIWVYESRNARFSEFEVASSGLRFVRAVRTLPGRIAIGPVATKPPGLRFWSPMSLYAAGGAEPQLVLRLIDSLGVLIAADTIEDDSAVKKDIVARSRTSGGVATG